MSAPGYTSRSQRLSDIITPELVDQDDILGASTDSQQGLPEYHSVGFIQLEVIRQALEDRAQYDKPEDSVYYVPPRSPKVDNINELLRHKPYHPSDTAPPELIQQQYNLLQAYFQVIQQGAWDIVQQLLRSGLVDANTVGSRLHDGCTPLMIAVKAKDKKVMVLLLENGALVDGWSGPPEFGWNKVIRTPLMVAATQGDLPTVKWLMEGYAADDAIVAPDGQLALRLAADAGHQHVVAYLPARRGGMYIRWKNKQAKLLSRIRGLFLDVWWLVKIISYEVPKWLICEVVVHPVRRGFRWCWKNKHFFLPFVKRQVKELPEKTARMAREVANWIRKIPIKIRAAVEWMWKALCRLPGEIHRFVKRIPEALRIAWNCVKQGAQTVWTAVSEVVEKFLSLLHTAVSAIVTFFRHLTLANLITAILDLLEAVFVTLPVKMWHLIDKVWEAGSEIVYHFFGWAGWLIWLLGYGIYRAAIFLPEQLLRVIGALGEMVAVSWREVRVWWNPKAI